MSPGGWAGNVALEHACLPPADARCDVDTLKMLRFFSMSRECFAITISEAERALFALTPRDIVVPRYSAQTAHVDARASVARCR